MSLTNLTSKDLRKAANLKEKIDDLQNQLNRLLGAVANGIAPGGRRRAAALARWAKVKGRRKGGKKRRMSAAARRRLAVVARARWKAAKAAGKGRL